MKAKMVIFAALIITFLFLVAGFILPNLIRPSKLYCETQEINIKTGKARYRTFKAGIMTSERIEDTALSLAIQEPVDVSSIAEWHKVNLFSPPSHKISPHYIFHSALYQAHIVDFIFRHLKPDESRKREIATTVLRLWQESGHDSGASDYIQKLEEEMPTFGPGSAGVDPKKAAPDR